MAWEGFGFARRSPLTGSNEGNHSNAGSSRNGILRTSISRLNQGDVLVNVNENALSRPSQRKSCSLWEVQLRPERSVGLMRVS